jgi:fatty acid desaturase
MALAAAPTELGDTSRRDLVGTGGVRYLDLRSRLTPRWGRLWASLLAGHVALALLVAAIAGLAGRSLRVDVLLVILGAGAVGYVVHYLVLFQHEAVHYNLAPTRRANDLACDVLIGPLIGETVAAYRTIHLEHHRHIGTPRDTERSYFEPFGVRFVLEGVGGVRIARIVRARLAHRATDADAAAGTGSGIPWVLLAAVALHGTVIAVALLTDRMPLALAWALGVGGVFPAINTTRQLLEHRDEHADPSVDYATVPHGEVNRLFGSGPLASTLGGAGFNRHLLHHWDPGVSCTRLDDLERFLLDTPAADSVRRRRTTYAATARRLVRLR